MKSTPSRKVISLAQRMKHMQRSTIREILKFTKQPGMISFAGGLPAPETFPVKEFGAALMEALRDDGVAALQYDVTEGYAPLKELLCKWLSGQGIQCNPDQMLLTNGSQQALDLLGKIFLDPGDAVLVENPTYLGAIQAFNAYQPKYRPIEMDDEGMRPDELRKELKRRRPKLAYLVPTFQNPSGITMTTSRRKEILSLLQRANVPVIEDDPYSYLRFSGQKAPSLYEVALGKGVIYTSTFSKLLSPGIRLGFVIADATLIEPMVLAKQAADLQPNSLIQRAVYRYMRSGNLDRHLPAIVEAYRKRAGYMMEAIEQHFPREVHWVRPEGGMFIWCRLPKGISAAKVFQKAIQQNVAFVMGSVFHACGGGDNTLRLNFTNSSREQIQDGIKRLGTVLQQAISSRD